MSFITSVKTINWIRGRALNHRLFKSLCQDFGSEHSVLLFHTEVRWLSRGRALTRFFELREEFKALLKERGYDLPKEMESQEFNQMLAYLSDIFTRMNDLSVFIQGRNITTTTTVYFNEVVFPSILGLTSPMALPQHSPPP